MDENRTSDTQQPSEGAEEAESADDDEARPLV